MSLDVALIGTVVGQLGIIAADPALGYRGAAITSALTLLSSIIVKGDEAKTELQDLSDKVAAMVVEGREPTKAELYELRDLSAAHHAVLNPKPDAIDQAVLDAHGEG